MENYDAQIKFARNIEQKIKSIFGDSMKLDFGDERFPDVNIHFGGRLGVGRVTLSARFSYLNGKLQYYIGNSSSTWNAKDALKYANNLTAASKAGEIMEVDFGAEFLG